MTRLLHTADLHLSSEHPERWEALEAVTDLAAEWEVDGVLVAGDLLDVARGSAALRARVKGAFERLQVPVFVIPGNHDRAAFAPGQDWGSRTHVLADEPACTSDALAGAPVTGIPFPGEPVSLTRILPDVHDAVKESASRIVLLHGTLVEAGDPHILSESQEDEGGRYFPCLLEELEALDVDYVALGHYHQPDLRRIGSGFVAYSGSPAPVGSHAWGPRRVVQIELGHDRGEETRVETVELPVPYRDRWEHWIDPFEEERTIETLGTRLAEGADARCDLTVEVDGILADMTEVELRDRIDELESTHDSGYRALTLRAGGVGLDPELADLFRDVRRRLDELSDDAEVFTEIAEDRSPAAGRLSRDDVRSRALQLAARTLKRTG